MFSPQALTGLNDTTSAKRVSLKEAKAWAKRKGQEWALLQVEELLAAGGSLYLVDDEIIGERQMDEQYAACDRCHALVLREPLTWGVMQYQAVDGDIVCNPCFAKNLADGVKVICGVNTSWPRCGGAGLTQDDLRCALDERVAETALEAAGYEKVLEEGVEGVGYGITPEAAVAKCAALLADRPQDLFVCTVIVWQFCADITLWRKEG